MNISGSWSPSPFCVSLAPGEGDRRLRKLRNSKLGENGPIGRPEELELKAPAR